MNPLVSRLSRRWLLGAIVLGALASAGPSPSTPLNPDKLLLLSSVDLKGKTSPCGCHIPKGGLARRAAAIDSLKAEYSRVGVVDAGGFFPELDGHQSVAAFLMKEMKEIGYDAAGMGEKELRFGYAFLKQRIKESGLDVLSANLVDAKTKKPALRTSLVKTIGGVKVGFFGLMSDKVELGPARDSLRVEEPSAAARRAIADLQKQGATVIVLLSQLGKVESEDLVVAVPGIDAVIVGHQVPMLQKGRMIKNTVACYGGEQGHYMGHTVLTLDARGKVTSGDNDVYALGPEVGERLDVAKAVKAFEDVFNEEQRKRDKEREIKAKEQQAYNADHFVGVEVCARCHTDEFEQWKTTSHSLGWQTLIDVKKDATPACIPCHVVGYQKPGGFQSQADAAKLGNIQCENCHGMGTRHDSFGESQNRVTEAACIVCHQGENDPSFDWKRQFPLIAHSNTSGETIKNKKVKDASSPMPAGMMGTHGTTGH